MKTFGGYTVSQLQDYIQHSVDTGDSMDDILCEGAATCEIISDLLKCISCFQQSPAAQSVEYKESTWKSRLQDEYDDLEKRLSKLNAFLDSDDFEKLKDRSSRMLLRAQKPAMETLLRILGARLVD